MGGERKFRRFAAAAAALLMVILTIGWGCAESEEPVWEVSAVSGVSPEAQAALEEAVKEMTGARYEPVAELGKNGDIYCLLCVVTGIYPGAQPHHALVYVRNSEIQNMRDFWIEDYSKPEELQEEKERTVDYSVLISDLAEAYSAVNLIETDLEAMEHDELAAFIAGKWNELFMEPGYRLYLNGKDDPSELQITGSHAFVVLGYQLQNGEMADELKARCEAAAAAWREFPDSILVCSGGATGENNPGRHTEAGLMKEYLSKTCGIPADSIFTDERAMTTLDNALNTFSILKDQWIEEITIVTSDYHQRRANLLYAVLAEHVRLTEGRPVAIVGNYGCEWKNGSKHEARIAAAQLDEMMQRLYPSPEE